MSSPIERWSLSSLKCNRSDKNTILTNHPYGSHSFKDSLRNKWNKHLASTSSPNEFRLFSEHQVGPYGQVTVRPKSRPTFDKLNFIYSNSKYLRRVHQNPTESSSRQRSGIRNHTLNNQTLHHPNLPTPTTPKSLNKTHTQHQTNC